jgi:hypothetical protein
MDNNNHSNHKQIISHLKPMVGNLQILNSFNDYVDMLIEREHKILEQADNNIIMYRSQGAIALLKRLKLLRDTVNNG